MRFRPSVRAPFIRYPKVTRDIPAAMRAKRTFLGSFTPGDGRRQCTAIGKKTGKQCRNNCVAHAPTCRSHRGTAISVVVLKRIHGAKFRRAASNSIARRTLFTVTLNPPQGFSSNAQGVQLGREIEAFRNQFKC